MTKVYEIAKVIEKIAPVHLAEDFDNVGLLLGDAEAEVKKVLLCLDADEFTAKEAEEKGADMIISHHPLIFHPLKSLEYSKSDARCMRTLIKSDIAVYSAHTNMDIADGGLNDLFCQKLSLKVMGDLEISSKEKACGRICEGNYTLSELVVKVKEAFGLTSVRYAGDDDKNVNKIAICSGSGRGLISDAIREKADVYITGDLTYSDIRNLRDENCAYIEIEHFTSEIFVTEIFAEIIKNAFPDVEILVSEEKNIIKRI